MLQVYKTTRYLLVERCLCIVQASRFLSSSVMIKLLSNAKYMVIFILVNWCIPQWNIPVNLPHMQHEVHWSNRKTVQSLVPGKLRDFKYSNGKSRFAAHLLGNKHSIGPMDNFMETLHTTGKGRMMDTLERFYIFRETKINNRINDRLTIKLNIIFETIVQKDPHRGLPAAY